MNAPLEIERKYLIRMPHIGALAKMDGARVFDIVQILPIELAHLPNYDRMGIQGGLLLLTLMQATYPLIRFMENFKSWVKSLASYFVGLLRKFN